MFHKHYNFLPGVNHATSELIVFAEKIEIIPDIHTVGTVVTCDIPKPIPSLYVVCFFFKFVSRAQCRNGNQKERYSQSNKTKDFQDA